ncbi:MAG: hypothetical protein ABSD62_14745 [Candidatus Limnocylindrales bacterium]|jgi:hypothetical protein
MNDQALGGLFLAALGVAIAWLWYRGYFNALIANATGGLTGTRSKVPFNFGTYVTGKTGLGSTAKPV